ncbi:two-component regulator propeller domain-containing protein [Fodinibius sp. N2]|uniref:two-component regulator propeller domain-containing protein n=1 Tax=Fodinibius alkaliphilus TaxID=3140241 RepID=UPI003159E6BE
MVIRKLFILSFLYLFFAGSMYAQQYNLNTYSVNKGLPHPKVHEVLQTSDGFIWAGTYGGGLAKFDGYEFSSFTNDDGLKDSSVETLYEDSSGTLWIGTYKSGVGKMVADSIVYPFDSTALSYYTVLNITEVREKGELWFGTEEGGFFIYDGENIKQYTTEDGLLFDTVWDFWEDSNGDIWIATQRGISIFDGESFSSLSEEDGFHAEKAFTFLPHEGNLWIGTDNGVSIWNGSTFSSIEDVNDAEIGYVMDIVVNSSGGVWLGSLQNGIFEISDTTSRHLTRKNGLSSNGIYDFHKDDQGNIWIGTNEDGITLYTGDNFKFFSEESGLGSSSVLSLYQDKRQNTWVGTYKGIYKHDGDGSFSHLAFPDEYDELGTIWDIASFSNGNMLFLMPNDAIYKYDGNEFQNFSKRNGFDYWFTYDLYIDQNDGLWVGTNEGLFNYRDGQLEHYTIEDGLGGNVILHIYQQGDNYWLGTRDGLSKFDGSTFVNYMPDDGLAHKEVTYITSDGAGDLWVGTAGGVSHVELDDDDNIQNITNFGKEDGLVLTTTQFLWFDRLGNLWQGTNGGIHKFHVPTYREEGRMEIAHYRLSNQGIGVETNHKAVLPIDSSTVWFGTMNGILEVDTEDLHQPDLALPVYFTKIEKNSNRIEKSSAISDFSYQFGRPLYENIEFSYGQDTYGFEFSALAFGDYGDITYRYKLEGFEEKWSEPSVINKATYTSLAPGNYKLIVQARIGEASWENNQASIAFSIAPPFWRAYWFYALVASSIVVLIYGYIQFRVNKLEKRELEKRVDRQTEHLTKALEEKEVLIKEIHHRVKNNLAVISGLLELQMGHAENNFVSRVLSESQRRVQSISMIHEKLYQNEHLAEIDFEKYVKELVDIVAYSFSNPSKDISVNIDIDNFKLGVDQGIPCGLILNEVVSNAFEHAFINQDSGTINISISLIGDKMLRLTVSDDGTGLPKDFRDKEQESLGLTLVETLGAQLMGTIDWKNTEQGSLFVLEFEKEQPSIDLPA